MKTAGRENQCPCAVPRTRAHGAAAQNSSCSNKWAEKQEKLQPLEWCFFLTSPCLESTQLHAQQETVVFCEDSSGGRQRLGHITKQGSSLLRFLLVEAAQAAVRCNADWRRRYRHLAMRRQRNIAKVAMGRRLGARLYWMWRNGREYSPSLEFGSHAGKLGIGNGGQ